MESIAWLRPHVRNLVRIGIGALGYSAFFADNPQIEAAVVAGFMWVANEVWYRWDKKYGGST